MNKKTLIISACVLTLLVALFGYGFANASFSGNLEDLPHYAGAPNDYSYAINTNSTHYFAYNGTTGYLEFSSTNTSYIFNAVTEALRNGRGGTVLIKEGLYDNIDSSILVSSGTHFIGEGRSYLVDKGTYLRMANYANVSMFKPYNLTADNNDISWEKMTLNGNGAHQSAGDIIYFQKCNFGYVRDCFLIEAYRDCIRFETGVAQGFNIINNRFQGTYTGSAIYGGTLTDSIIFGNNIDTLYSGSYNGAHAIWLTSVKVRVEGNQIVASYDYGIYCGGGGQHTITGNDINSNRKTGILLEGTSHNIVSNNLVYNNGKYGTGNYDGITIYNSNNNIITNNQAFDNSGSATQLNGIRELGSSDYNLIVGCYATENTNVQILTLGANTECHSCFNGTSWIT